MVALVDGVLLCEFQQRCALLGMASTGFVYQHPVAA
jgi:hypothetical protein